MPRQKTQGKFWPQVRALIWEKAQELYQMENAKTMQNNFKGTTATKKELREGRYFQTAKLIVLRNLWREKKGLPSIGEEAYTPQEQTIIKEFLLPFINPKPQNNKCKGGGKRKCLNLE
ncbi:hypothetical protein C0199_00090 [Candidatus Bathyarchaeota archaeon]|nr:MAG: hypothetical protein C0199_00090 [Candidatus Bathyarchaeota archaeon]